MAKLLSDFLFAGNQFGSSREDIAALVTKGLSAIESRNRTGRIYASDGGRCERAGALLAQLPSVDNKSASLMAYAKLGDAIEAVVVDALTSQDAVLFRQYHLPDVGLNLGGYVDAIIVHNGRIRILEVKSCSKLPTEPKPLHAAQTAIYSAITGFPAILFYMSRSVANYHGELMTKQFDLQESGAAQREALFRVAYANLAVQAGLTPGIPNHLHKASDCGFCPFIPVCWDSEDGQAWPPGVTPEQHVQLVATATATVDRLLNPTVAANRRIGIMNFLQKTGGPTAQRVLTATDWNELTGGGPELTANAWSRSETGNLD